MKSKILKRFMGKNMVYKYEFWTEAEEPTFIFYKNMDINAKNNPDIDWIQVSGIHRDPKTNFQTIKKVIDASGIDKIVNFPKSKHLDIYKKHSIWRLYYDGSPSKWVLALWDHGDIRNRDKGVSL